eukprot:scaffold1939_cov392-Prasinococcus_capsulatus_cf.AAC.3
MPLFEVSARGLNAPRKARLLHVLVDWPKTSSAQPPLRCSARKPWSPHTLGGLRSRFFPLTQVHARAPRHSMISVKLAHARQQRAAIGLVGVRRALGDHSERRSSLCVLGARSAQQTPPTQAGGVWT